MTATPVEVPYAIAAAVVLPESYRDERAVYGAYAWLRDNCPLGLAKVDGYDPVWLVSRHADIVAVERDARVFHNGDFNQVLRPQASDRFQKDVLGNGDIRILPTPSALDDPEHAQLRAAAGRWFMPPNLRMFHERMQVLAKEAVDHLRDMGGVGDFARDFAKLYPLRVIMTLLGVPSEDEPLMLELTQEFFGTRPSAKPKASTAAEADPAAIATQFHASINGFLDYFEGLADERRKRPREDFISHLVAAEQEGRLEPRYRNAFCISTATAGHDTTASSIAGGMLALIQDPAELAAVKADHELVAGLVDESMRWATPVKHFMRSAAEPARVRGQEIGRGERLMMLYGSANRDADVFDAPDRFNVSRGPNRHLALGTGPHMCLGQHVAKAEMRILWRELLPRLEGIALAGEPTYVASSWVGGLDTLPVQFSVS